VRIQAELRYWKMALWWLRYTIQSALGLECEWVPVRRVGVTFREFRADGWPLCPRCEEDELYSFLALTEARRVTVAECLADPRGFRCYRCDWTGNAFVMQCRWCGGFMKRRGDVGRTAAA
jgi:hypothetical protein